MSDTISLAVIGATYNNLDEAKSDYETVKSLYYDWDLMDTFDAAVLQKTDKGKVKIVKTHEQPTRQGAWAGAGLGIATGLVAALFPAVVLGGGLLAGMAGAGAAAGAIAGHAVGGMSRGDLKDLGELLDEGESGLLVIAATDVSERVQNALSSAQKVVNKEVKADQKEIEKELKELEKG